MQKLLIFSIIFLLGCTSKPSEEAADTTAVTVESPATSLISGDYKVYSFYQKDSSAIKGLIQVETLGMDYHIVVSSNDDKTATFKYEWRGPMVDSLDLTELNQSIRVRLSPTTNGYAFEEIWESGPEVIEGTFEDGLLNIASKRRDSGETTITLIARQD